MPLLPRLHEVIQPFAISVERLPRFKRQDAGLEGLMLVLPRGYRTITHYPSLPGDLAVGESPLKPPFERCQCARVSGS